RGESTHARSGVAVSSIRSISTVGRIGSAEVASALRGVGVGALDLMPRSYVVMAGHGRGYEHGGSDESSGQQFDRRHSVSPYVRIPERLAPSRKSGMSGRS